MDFLAGQFSYVDFLNSFSRIPVMVGICRTVSLAASQFLYVDFGPVPFMDFLLYRLVRALVGRAVARYGAAAVRRCGTIEATVHDIFDGDDIQIAILDTTVNHMSEVFEFQFEPEFWGTWTAVSTPISWPVAPAWPAMCLDNIRSTAP